MNKSILKHEIRSIKWILLLSILVSFFVVVMFDIELYDGFERMFSSGILIDKDVINDAFRTISDKILMLFTIISIMLVFMQYRGEKNQEIGRFLKSLPLKKEEFFKVKLSMGIINLTIAFIVLTIGIIVVRSNNMFWINDIYRISNIPEPLVKVDGVINLLKSIGLIYLVVLSFYTFLFMVQYTFTNLVGGIVTGILVWLAPLFIIITSTLSLERFINLDTKPIDRILEFILPWLYPTQYSGRSIDTTGMSNAWIMSIDELEIKIAIVLALTLINIGIGYKLNKSSKIENENMVIPFKIISIIFKIGVTICSGLLLPIIIEEIMKIYINDTMFIIFNLIGAAIGYFISRKITEI